MTTTTLDQQNILLDSTKSKIIYLLNQQDWLIHQLARHIDCEIEDITRNYQQLTALGIPLFIDNQIIRLTKPADLLHHGLIGNYLADYPEVHHETYQQVYSTNTLIKSSKYAKQTSIAIAEEQINGQGRQEKIWVSPFGKGICCSIRFALKKKIHQYHPISLIAATSLLKALQNYGITEKFQLKWPNDLMYKNNKCAGILVESLPRDNKGDDVIIGIGINVHPLSKHAETAITQQHIELDNVCHEFIDRNRLCGLLIQQLIHDLKLLNNNKLVWRELWQQHNYLEGKTITVQHGQHNLSGKFVDINEHGELMLELQDHTIKKITSGTITQIEKIEFDTV